MALSFKRFFEAADESSQPTNPDNKKNDSTVGDIEMDISKDQRDTIDKGELLTSLKPLYFKSHGVKAAPPIFLQVMEKMPDGGAKVLVKYSLCNSRKLRTPEGYPLEKVPSDQPAYLSRQELDDVRYGAFSASGTAVPPPPGGM